MELESDEEQCSENYAEHSIINIESKQEDTGSDTRPEQLQGNDGSTSPEKDPLEMDIDPENEVKGIRLLLIHTSICLCTSLIGLVSFGTQNPRLTELTADLNKGLQLDCDGSSSDHIRLAFYQ